MSPARIEKSFKLESEPVLRWPIGPTKLVRLKGLKLSYSGKGIKYDLKSDRTAFVTMVEWKSSRAIPRLELKDLFSEPQLEPNGLRALARLHDKFTTQTLCDYISQNGLLGFRPET